MKMNKFLNWGTVVVCCALVGIGIVGFTRNTKSALPTTDAIDCYGRVITVDTTGFIICGLPASWDGKWYRDVYGRGFITFAQTIDSIVPMLDTIVEYKLKGGDAVTE